jgi:hypothetical protein
MASSPPTPLPPPCCELVPFSNGLKGGKGGACASEVVQKLLRYAQPDVAAAVAVFGIGVAALPLLVHCRLDSDASLDCRSADSPLAEADLQTQGVEETFSYAHYARTAAGSLFQLEELRARLGSLDPSFVAAELQMDALDITRRSSQMEQEVMKVEVQDMQALRDSMDSNLTLLEKRSAYAYLGLGMDADPEAVHRSYKQKALAVHPDKGGSEEDFMNLQAMVVRLEESDVASQAEQSSNLYSAMKEMMRRAKEKDKKIEDPMQNLPEEMKLKQKRAALHDEMLLHWDRSLMAQQQLFDSPNGKKRSGPILEPLRKLVGDLSEDIATLPKGSGAEIGAERLLCRLMRRGIEILVAAAMVDTTAALEIVALHFSGPLLQATRASGPCPRLEQRCHLLMSALSKVSGCFRAFMELVNERLENKSASEWKGCKEDFQVGMSTSSEKMTSPQAEESVDPKVHVEPQPSETNAGNGCTQAEESVDPKLHVEPQLSEANTGNGSMATPKAINPLEEGQRSVPAVCEVKQEGAIEAYLPESQALQLQIDYTTTREWRSLRAICVKKRICVDFQRDSGGERCVAKDCCFRHECALCGAVSRTRKCNPKHHGAWNCHLVLGWLAEQQGNE